MSLLATGSQLVCICMPAGALAALHAAVGAGCALLACVPPRRGRWLEAAMPTGIVRCDPAALPILSHAADVVVGPAAALVDEPILAEVRRILTPAGLLVVYTGSEQTDLDRLRTSAAAEGFTAAAAEAGDLVELMRSALAADCVALRAPRGFMTR